MNQNLDTQRCLAAYAVFRDLSDNSKSVYDALGEFIKLYIHKNSATIFSVEQITNYLNEECSFDIPSQVTAKILNKLEGLNRVDYQYMVDWEHKSWDTDLATRLDEQQRNVNRIIDALFNYFTTNSGENIESNRDEILNAFYAYLLHESINTRWVSLISAFILHNKKVDEFTSTLEKIKQGVILHAGLSYTPSNITLGNWDTTLKIYLDTDILFHISGYNGDSFKLIGDDLLKLINEINIAHQRKKPGEKLIHLNYTEETAGIADKFFNKAASLLRNNKYPDPSNTAMIHILERCKRQSDFTLMRLDFFRNLKLRGILDDDIYIDPNSDQYRRYNIVTPALDEQVSEREDIQSKKQHYFSLLNTINVLREGYHTSGFENIQYILLTENSVIREIAKQFKSNGDVPLSTNCHFLINKFWFKLNKGFSNNDYPKSFDVVSAALLALQGEGNKRISEDYRHACEEFEAGKVSEKETKERVAELRQKSKTVESMNKESYEEDLSYVLTGSLQHLDKERQIKEMRLKKSEEDKLRLEDELLQERKERERERKEREQEQREHQDIKNSLYEDKLAGAKRKALFIHATGSALVSILLLLFIFVTVINLNTVSSIITVVLLVGGTTISKCRKRILSALSYSVTLERVLAERNITPPKKGKSRDLVI